MNKEDWVQLLALAISTLLVLTLCIAPVFAAACISANLDCRGISNVTGLRTEWHVFGGCFVLVNGEWLPLDVWKSITINEGLDR